MESNTGFFCKLAAGAIFILLLIAGIVWGIHAQNLFPALIFWAVALLFCLLLFAVGEILSTLTRLEYYALMTAQKSADEEDAPIKDGWVCKSCGAVNPKYVVECKQCATSKFE
ncbi:MAG: hypothetical protein HFI90_10170 [Clostridia bacterium]|nr:hypothetical protein [Clostridia bacterium]